MLRRLIAAVVLLHWLVPVSALEAQPREKWTRQRLAQSTCVRLLTFGRLGKPLLLAGEDMGKIFWEPTRAYEGDDRWGGSLVTVGFIEAQNWIRVKIRSHFFRTQFDSMKIELVERAPIVADLVKTLSALAAESFEVKVAPYDGSVESHLKLTLTVRRELKSLWIYNRDVHRLVRLFRAHYGFHPHFGASPEGTSTLGTPDSTQN